MTNIIDHLILAVSPEEQGVIATALTAAGFVDHGQSTPAPADGFEDKGAIRNQYLSFSGGGFIEMLAVDEITPEVELWFEETPRIQGIGFSTDRYDEQATPWASMAGSWNEEFGKHGDEEYFWAAGPLTHEAKFYPFVMGRPRTPYADVASPVELRKVVFAGRNSDHWKQGFGTWFELTSIDGGYRADDGVVLEFIDGEHEDMRVSAVFDVPGESVTIPISGGTIELRGAST